MRRNSKDPKSWREELEETSTFKVSSEVTKFPELAGEVITAILCLRKDQIVFGKRWVSA